MHDISILRDTVLSDADLTVMDKLSLDEEWILLNKQYHIINFPYILFREEYDTQRMIVRTLKWENVQIWRSEDKTPKQKRAESDEKNKARKLEQNNLDIMKGYYKEYRDRFIQISHRKQRIKENWIRVRKEKKSLVENLGLTKPQEYLLNRRIKNASKERKLEERRRTRGTSTFENHESRMRDIQDRLYNRGKYSPHVYVGSGKVCERCGYPDDRYPHVDDEEQTG
jgi:hypothetical protein